MNKTPDGQLVTEFIKDQEWTLTRYLDGSLEQKKITQTYYDYAKNKPPCEADDWDGASEYFQAALTEFIEQCQHYALYRLLERAEKGEELLAGLKPNDINQTKWRRALDELYRQIEQYQRESTKDQPHDGERNKSA
jgi:hypothetical protein